MQNNAALGNDSTAEAIVQAVGWRGLNRLIDAFGGFTLCIPAKTAALKDDHHLVVAVGEADAAKLVERFSGEKIYIPNDKKQPSTLEEAFLSGVQEGKSNIEIAHDHGVTDRWVRQVLSRNGIKNPNRSSLKTLLTVSNGGLTGIAAHSANQTARAAETRASGL